MTESLPPSDPTTAAPGATAERPSRIAPVLVGATVGVVLVVIGTAALLLTRRTAPPGPVDAGATASAPIAATATADTRRPLPSLERQTAVRRLAEWQVEPFDRLAPTEGTAAAFEPILRPPPPFDAIDATLFDAFDVRIRLAHARPVGRDEACLDTQGNRFACGLRGRASLQNFLFGKRPACIRLFLGGGAGGVVDARCSVDGSDLAERQIRAGWAFPSELADASHHAALEAARREHLGVWAGPYEMPRIDQSVVDAQEVAFGSLRRSP